METINYSISGMSCGHCVAAVKQALDGLDGVQIEALTVGAATVRYDAAAVTPDRIARAIAEEGYEAREQPAS